MTSARSPPRCSRPDCGSCDTGWADEGSGAAVRLYCSRDPLSGGVAVSSGSGSGSGADQHLLALLRAIRLRQAAPDAGAAGAADTAAALTQLDEIRRRAEAEAGAGDGPAGA